MDLVAVTYAADFDLLKLQAASLNKFVKGIDKIYIISNSDVDLNFIKRYYGNYAGHVEIKYWYDLAADIDHLTYNAQQVEKCLAANLVSTDVYLVLDSKNFFIKPYELTKPIASVYGPQGFVFRPHEKDYWSNTCDFFEIKTDQRPLLYSTPFFVHKKLMQDMIAFIEKKSNKTLSEFFYCYKQMFEFFIYSAYIQRLGNYENFYCLTDRFVSSIWPNTVNLKHCQIEYLKQDQRIIASGIHRTAYASIDLDLWTKYICDDLELLSQDEFLAIHQKNNIDFAKANLHYKK